MADPERLADIRRNRVAIMRENSIKEYTDLIHIKEEVIKTYNFAKTWGCKFLVLLPKIKKY